MKDDKKPTSAQTSATLMISVLRGIEILLSMQCSEYGYTRGSANIDLPVCDRRHDKLIRSELIARGVRIAVVDLGSEIAGIVGVKYSRSSILYRP